VARLVARSRDGSGQALPEFALVLPLLMVVLLGMLDFGKAFNYWINVTHLANEGARWSVVDKNPGGTISLQNYIKQQADTAELRDGATVCINLIHVSSGSSAPYGPGDAVEMRVTYPYNWLPFFQKRLGFATTTITGSATMRLESTPSNYAAGCATPA
jgi:Flp pilus assembly protein TadG